MKTANRFVLTKKQNIFESIEQILTQDRSTNIVVPFVCSNNQTFKSKFLGESFKKFNNLETNFFVNKTTLGKADFYRVKTTSYKNSIIFASMPCHHAKGFGRKIHYGELASCMHQISNAIQRSMKTSEEFNVSIHAPKFGTGKSGGDWRIISELMNDIWETLEVTIYAP
jgi:hypothetical protein